MLHRVDDYGSDTIMITFNEVQALLRAFWKKDMSGTIKNVDSRHVPMVGTLEAHNEWLLITRSLDVFESGIHGLAP